MWVRGLGACRADCSVFVKSTMCALAPLFFTANRHVEALIVGLVLPTVDGREQAILLKLVAWPATGFVSILRDD